ncbi:MAG: NADH-quinone oxidoreductase subunit NuoH [Phycisphaerae bacterium]
MLSNQLTFSLIIGALTVFILLHLAGAGTLAERKFASWIQDRRGPNRVGFWGFLQPLADGIKFILKEDIIPANVDKPIFILAPFFGMVIAFITFAVIPWAGAVHFPWMAEGETVGTELALMDVGLLYIIAVSSLSVYGVVLGGWASNNIYSFYGGMRATAQMLSYEVPLGLGILCIMLASGSLNPNVIIEDQVATTWNIFLHPVAFILVLVAAFAETNRTPFDLAEAEQELVGGYHTEYSAMKFAIFPLAEYAHMAINGALLALLFFGGWSLSPFGMLGWDFGINAESTVWWAALIKFVVFWGKVCFMLGVYIVVRWTIPRYRFDQLMRMAWKGLIPAGVALVFLTGLLVVFDLHTHRTWWWSLAVNFVVFVIFVFFVATSKEEITGRQANMPKIDVLGRDRRNLEAV